jgi:hypothetical protein
MPRRGKMLVEKMHSPASCVPEVRHVNRHIPSQGTAGRDVYA